MNAYTKKIVLKNNIATWVKLKTEMIPYGLLEAAIKSNLIEWTEISKKGHSTKVHLLPEAYVWQFRDYFLDEWVANHAEEIADIGFTIYSSCLGNYLVHPVNTQMDEHWENLKKLNDEM